VMMSNRVTMSNATTITALISCCDSMSRAPTFDDPYDGLTQCLRKGSLSNDPKKEPTVFGNISVVRHMHVSREKYLMRL